MTATILDGKALAASREEAFRHRAGRLSARGIVPRLATILVGDDPASATYVRMKGNACRRVGITPVVLRLPATTDTANLQQHIETLNEDAELHGILLQHPVPQHIDERACFESIATAKDVDGVTSHSFGLMAMGAPAYGAATPAGIMHLLAHYDIPLEGMNAVVVGRSPILGKPMAMMLLNANATVTLCHSRTRELPEIVSRAELLVGALGKPRFLRCDWIRPGACVVDAGYHPGGVGDIEEKGLAERACAYTPVPGGVGPMTINTLILQTLEAAEKSAA